MALSLWNEYTYIKTQEISLYLMTTIDKKYLRI